MRTTVLCAIALSALVGMNPLRAHHSSGIPEDVLKVGDVIEMCGSSLQRGSSSPIFAYAGAWRGAAGLAREAPRAAGRAHADLGTLRRARPLHSPERRRAGMVGCPERGPMGPRDVVRWSGLHDRARPRRGRLSTKSTVGCRLAASSCPLSIERQESRDRGRA
jgi:hypothetical protein